MAKRHLCAMSSVALRSTSYLELEAHNEDSLVSIIRRKFQRNLRLPRPSHSIQNESLLSFGGPV